MKKKLVIISRLAFVFSITLTIACIIFRIWIEDTDINIYIMSVKTFWSLFILDIVLAIIWGLFETNNDK